ncbi:MAG: metal-dependent hydrolase [Nautiliaceae bacterium]
MANFSTHINVAAFVSATTTWSFYHLSLVSKEDAPIYFLAGIIGGILPDIDHDNSTPLKIMQFLFANIFAFLSIYKFIGKLPILNLALIWIGSYLVCNIIFFIFKKITKHRGIIHSIPTAFILWFLSTVYSYYFMNLGVVKSYLIGFFLFLGYITHLVLDEIYAVDIAGNRLKNSFGSALKLFGRNSKINIVVYMILGALIIALPHKEVLINIFQRVIK